MVIHWPSFKLWVSLFLEDEFSKSIFHRLEPKLRFRLTFSVREQPISTLLNTFYNWHTVHGTICDPTFSSSDQQVPIPSITVLCWFKEHNQKPEIQTLRRQGDPLKWWSYEVSVKVSEERKVFVCSVKESYWGNGRGYRNRHGWHLSLGPTTVQVIIKAERPPSST